MGRFLKRFDFIAREISSFAAREAKRGCEKTRKKATEQSPVSHMTFGLPIHLPSGFRFPIPLRSLAPRSRHSISLFFLYREVVKVVCTRTGWQIGRGISFYRMRGLHARKEVGKVSGRMQYSRRLGRQRMSSAHESGYPNEIQYGNVEDHPTDFTPCSLDPLSRSPSYNKNVVSSDTSPFVRFHHGCSTRCLLHRIS